MICAIALNDLVTGPDRNGVVDVLLGASQWRIAAGGEEAAGHSRRRDGIWAAANEQGSERPAGLILVRGVRPWSIAQAEPELWDNPLAPREHWLPSWPFRRYRWDVPGSGEFMRLPHERATL